MTHGEFDVFTLSLIIVCCVMAVFNLLKNGWRGSKGMILSASFLVFGGTLCLYRSGASLVLVYGGCVVLFLLLAADVVIRASKPQTRKKR